MSAISLSRVHYPVTTLGPGKRVGVWFQGCSIRCQGCVSTDTWAHGEGTTTVGHVLETISAWAGVADGLTVSGGEPFEQPEALAALLHGWRRLTNGDVLVFTGFEFPVIAPFLASHPDIIDAVISGPYDRHAPQTLALRGSDNQNIHVLTNAGSRFAAYDRPTGPDDKRLDVMFDDAGTVWLAGIPDRNDIAKLRKALRAEGHQVVLSDTPDSAR